MCLGSIYSLMHWCICCCSTTFLVMTSFLYLRFYFEITTVLNNYRFTYKRIERDLCTLCHISPKGNILKSCTTISQSGYWHWYSQDSEYFNHHRIPHFAFLGTHSLPLSTLIPWKPFICSPFLQLCHSRNDIYMRSCSLWSWDCLFPQRNSLQIHPSLTVTSWELLLWISPSPMSTSRSFVKCHKATSQ